MTNVTRRTRRNSPKSTVTEPKKFQTQKFFGAKISLGPKISLDPQFFLDPIFFWNKQFFFNQNIFLTRHFFQTQNFFQTKNFFSPKTNFNENDLWRDKTELLNLRLSKLPSLKVLLKLELDTKDQVLLLVIFMIVIC